VSRIFDDNGFASSVAPIALFPTVEAGAYEVGELRWASDFETSIDGGFPV